MLALLRVFAAIIIITQTMLLSADAQSSTRMTPIVRAIAAAKPCVVNIEGKKTVRNEGADGNSQNSFKQVKGMGTGVIIDQRGYILTNYHVVDGVSRIQVRLADQTQTIARLIAHDSRTDLAIIKIDLESESPVIKFGTSSDLMEGETVIAMGNAYGYRHSSTRGIISSLHRNVPISESQVYYDLIQTDAPINPGNSGGPMLNIDGECIGINAAVRGGAQCIAFAIPINAALDVAADLLQVETKDSLSLDFETMTIYENHRARLLVKSVSADNSNGLHKGDVIETINGTQVFRRLDLERSLIGLSSGQDIELGIRRDGEELLATINTNSKSSAAKPVVEPEYQSLAWDMLGLALEPISSQEFAQLSTKHNGGMRVVKVRSNGPAASQSIRAGDVLIGIHEWETTSENDVEFILNQDEIRSRNQVKYFILRGQSTLWGNIRVASRVD